MAKFVPCESYKHKMAKDLLVTWLRDLDENNDSCKFGCLTWRSNYGVHAELPFHENDNPYYFELSEGLIEDTERSRRKQYNHQEFFDPTKKHLRGKLLFVPDIVIFHKGAVKYLIEVVNKSAPTEKKVNDIGLFFDTKECGGYYLYTVSADHILGQIQKPESLSFDLILTDDPF